jgi:hypothetical protein
MQEPHWSIRRLRRFQPRDENASDHTMAPEGLSCASPWSGDRRSLTDDVGERHRGGSPDQRDIRRPLLAPVPARIDHGRLRLRRDLCRGVVVRLDSLFRFSRHQVPRPQTAAGESSAIISFE